MGQTAPKSDRLLERRIARRTRADTAAAAADRRALARFFKGLQPGQKITSIPVRTWHDRLARLETSLARSGRVRTRERVRRAVAKPAQTRYRVKALVEHLGFREIFPLRKADLSRVGEYWSDFRKLLRSRNYAQFQADWRRRATVKTTEGSIRLETNPERLRKFIEDGDARGMEDPMMYANTLTAAA